MTIYQWAADGPPPRTARDVTAIITEVWASKAQMIAIPAERLGDEFFDLSTRIAGEVLQKFVQYRVRVAIIGDISRYVAASNALRDFVYESNRGRQVWFATTQEELAERLARETAASTAATD
jgi:hypothetical protein